MAGCMNLHTAIDRPQPMLFRASDFWTLRTADRFAAYEKSELIEGELLGVPRQAEDEDESDARVPIRLSVEDYALLDRSGAFVDVGNTELIDGVVYTVSPQHRPHGFAKDEIAFALRLALKGLHTPWHVATEQSVVFDDRNEPQPDIILTSEPRGDGPIPGSSVALVVEVSATTAGYDLTEKVRLYASSGVPEYWVADIKAERMYRLSSPEENRYAQRSEISFGEVVQAVTIPGLAIDTDTLR